MSTRTPARFLAAMLLAAVSASFVGCTSHSEGDASEETPSARNTVSGELSVFAAASLQPAFEPLAEAFTLAHPDVDLSFTFDGSSVLATQILAGAPVDLFASADEANMQKVVDEALNDGEPTIFATSELVIAVAPGNPFDIANLTDLTTPTVDGTTPVIVLCAAEVPCGTASHTLLDRDGVTLTPASEEQNVTAVLTKVRAGEADAGLVYASDVLRAEGDVEGVPITNADEAAGRYAIAPMSGAASPEAAQAFVEFLGSKEAKQLFKDLGFRAA